MSTCVSIVNVMNVCVIDECVENTSDHLPVAMHISLSSIVYHSPVVVTQRKRAWHRLNSHDVGEL